MHLSAFYDTPPILQASGMGVIIFTAYYFQSLRPCCVCVLLHSVSTFILSLSFTKQGVNYCKLYLEECTLFTAFPHFKVIKHIG